MYLYSYSIVVICKTLVSRITRWTSNLKSLSSLKINRFIAPVVYYCLNNNNNSYLNHLLYTLAIKVGGKRTMSRCHYLESKIITGTFCFVFFFFRILSNKVLGDHLAIPKFKAQNVHNSACFRDGRIQQYSSFKMY